MLNPLNSVAGLHKKGSFMHWKSAMSVVGNGSESWGEIFFIRWIPFETAPKRDAAQKMWLFYKVHEEREKKDGDNGVL